MSSHAQDAGRLLEGRVAIVTGGGRGIGRAHSLELAAHGATVVVNDYGVALDGSLDPGHSPADAVVTEIEAGGGRASANHCSVADWAATAELIATTVERHGRLDIVVNNAGITRDRMITSMSPADWSAVLEVHLAGTFNLTKHACDHWRGTTKSGEPQSGRIINTTSGTGLFGNVGQSAYGAAKAGIANLTMTTALEMGRYGCTANAISPVAMTRMLSTMPGVQPSLKEDGWDPLDPANSSPVVAWLASEASGWLTGAVLRVTGNRVQRVRPWEVDDSVSFEGAEGERLDASSLDIGLRRAYGLVPMGLAAGNRARP